MSQSVHQTSCDLLCRVLRQVLCDAVQAGPGAAGAIGTVECQAVAALYLLLMDHPIDQRGRCRSCRRPGAVFGLRWRRCRVHVKAALCLRQPEALLRRLLVHGLGLAAPTPPAVPGRALASDPGDTEVLPRVAADPPTDRLQTPAVPSTPLPPAGQPELGHGGAGDDPPRAPGLAVAHWIIRGWRGERHKRAWWTRCRCGNSRGPAGGAGPLPPRGDRRDRAHRAPGPVAHRRAGECGRRVVRRCPDAHDIEIVTPGQGMPCTVCLATQALGTLPAGEPGADGADATGLAAGGVAYQGWGWPVTLHRDQVRLSLHRDVSALAIPVPLGTEVTEILARRRCAPPVLAHPYAPDHRIVLTGERYGVTLPWPHQVHQVTGILLLPPTVTPRGPITWIQPPQEDSLQLCREIDLFGVLRTALRDSPPDGDPP